MHCAFQRFENINFEQEQANIARIIKTHIHHLMSSSPLSLSWTREHLTDDSVFSEDAFPKLMERRKHTHAFPLLFPTLFPQLAANT